MSFTASWHTLLDELDELPESATLITPLSHQRFRIADVQDARVIIQFEDRDETRPLQRDQFETLYRRIEDAPDGFDLDRLPPDADPYPTVWSVHPRFEVDEDVKESRLQGLKDRLAASEDNEANQLRAEIKELEQRIDDLTSFRTGTEMQG